MTMGSRLRERLFTIFLVALVVITASTVLVLRLAPATTGSRSGETPTVTPYTAAEIASQYVSDVYQVAPGDLQVADATRSTDAATGQAVWRYKFLDKASGRTYEVVIDDWGRVVK